MVERGKRRIAHGFDGARRRLDARVQSLFEFLDELLIEAERRPTGNTRPRRDDFPGLTDIGESYVAIAWIALRHAV